MKIIYIKLIYLYLENYCIIEVTRENGTRCYTSKFESPRYIRVFQAIQSRPICCRSTTVHFKEERNEN